MLPLTTTIATDIKLNMIFFQTTVGFGNRFPTEECPEGIFMFIVQIIVGVMIDGALIGIIYAKLTRPPRKHFDFKFSSRAVVYQRDSQLCLIFRICDPNEIHAVDSKIHACLLENRMYEIYFCFFFSIK